MKNLLLILFLTIGFSVGAQDVKKMSRSEKRVHAKKIKLEEERIKAKKDSMDHIKALYMLENNHWAFEAKDMRDDEGTPINHSFRPNIAAFDGVDFFAEVIYKVRNEYLGDSYRQRIYDSRGKLLSQKRTKKGNIVFKYITYAPTSSNPLIELDASSGFVTLTIGGAYYFGKIIPISESRYFMTYERKSKRNKKSK